MVEIPPPSEEEFPMYLYIHNHEGFHDGKLKIPDQAALRRVFPEMITPAIRAKLEVVVTDALDFCIFHAKGGSVIFPTPEQSAKIAAS